MNRIESLLNYGAQPECLDILKKAKKVEEFEK
jgi:hypothetical protein